MKVRPAQAFVFAALVLNYTEAQAFDHGRPPSEVLHIIQNTKFRVVYRTSQIPVQPLIAAKFLPRNRLLNSFLAGPGEACQSGTHTLLDDSRPMRKLIFAAISPEYIVLCFFHSDWPEDVCYMSVIHVQGAKAKEIFFCTLDGEAHGLFDLRYLLRTNQISVLGVS